MRSFTQEHFPAQWRDERKGGVGDPPRAVVHSVHSQVSEAERHRICGEGVCERGFPVQKPHARDYRKVQCACSFVVLTL